MSTPKVEAGANDTGRVKAGATVPKPTYHPSVRRPERGANSTGPSKPV